MSRIRRLIHDVPSLTAWVLSELGKVFPRAKKIVVVSVEPLGSIQNDRGIARIFVRIDTKKHTLYANQQPSAKQLYSVLTAITPHFRSLLETVHPIALDPNSHILLYEEVAGVRVRDLLEKKKLPFAQAKRTLLLAAKWFQRLHTITPPRTLATRPSRFRLQDFSNTPSSKKLAPVLARLVQRIRKFDAHRPAVIVHGDPHIANMIATKNHGLGVIDFSEARRGNPWYDIGMLFMHLELALHQYFTEPQIQQLQELFLKKYLSNKKVSALQLEQLKAYKVRAALDFYKLTAAHHSTPSPYERWMLQRLESVIFSS